MANRSKAELSPTKLEKAHNTLGVDTVKEMEAMPAPDLKKRIVEAATAKAEVAMELEHNPEYVGLKEDLKALTAGKREVDKRQNAIIALALHLLSERGEA